VLVTHTLQVLTLDFARQLQRRFVVAHSFSIHNC
jgi:hypothetical protein